ncbi:Josephin-domain-containing protein [Neocallimastix lanati (nom. inval.)]|jgi:hypothetical protein|nr:Josephin-domain-containing protein [Neocallimastix sp. JGI-2020a]
MSRRDFKNKKNIVFGHIYHEKQHLGYCAKHALNNLFQKEEFTIADLDKICKLLKVQYGSTKFFNPHKSILPIGNYDINVIMWALESRGKEMKWFDSRHADDIDELDIDNLYGIIINKGSTGSVFSKHWYTLRPLFTSQDKIIIHETKRRPKTPPSPSPEENINEINTTNSNSTNIDNNSNNNMDNKNDNNKKNNNDKVNDNNIGSDNSNIVNNIKNIEDDVDHNKNNTSTIPPKIPLSSTTTTTITKTNITIINTNNNNSNNSGNNNNNSSNCKTIELEPLPIINNNINGDEEDDNDFPWWNLDSKLENPIRFLAKEDLIFHLKCQILNNAQIILIYNKS